MLRMYCEKKEEQIVQKEKEELKSAHKHTPHTHEHIN